MGNKNPARMGGIFRHVSNLIRESLSLHFCRKRALSMTARVWVPSPIRPSSSEAVTLKVIILPLAEIPVTSAVADTFMPTGVGARWLELISTPTVPLPSGSSPCTHCMAAFSIRPIMKGVPNTSSPPEPTALAVISGVTVFSIV